MCQRNVKFRNLTVYLSSSVTENIKKDLKKKFNKFKIHDNDWDEVRDVSGRIVALTVFVKVPDIAEALLLLSHTFGVINTVLGDILEPMVVISSPLELSSVSGMVSLQAIVPEKKNQVKRVEYLIGDISLGSSMVAPYSVTFDSTLFANGETDIVAVCYDKKGKLIGKSVELTVTLANVSTMPEWSATPESLAELLANGTMSAPSMPSIAYVDGKAIISATPEILSGGYWELDTSGITPLFPNVCSMEARIAFLYPEGYDVGPNPLGGLFQFSNNSSFASFNLYADGSFDLNGNVPNGDVPGHTNIDLRQLHTYKLEITTTNIILSIDGVAVITAPAGDIIDGGNYTTFQLWASAGVPDVPFAQLEYIKWTSI